MTFEVFLTRDAAADLEELFNYIAAQDGPARAQRILTNIERVFSRLGRNPRRGSYPKELLELGIREYREVLYKPWRIIYRIVDQRVYVLLIADSRRDMQSLLARRLLQG